MLGLAALGSWEREDARELDRMMRIRRTLGETRFMDVSYYLDRSSSYMLSKGVTL
jgi:hypothetical protein